MPGKLQTANIADWGEGIAPLTEMTGVLNGGFIEATMGYAWSPESWGGWSTMMAWYRKALRAVAEPKLVVFHQGGDSRDLKTFRYGFSSSLMDDGFYNFSDDRLGGYRDVIWFDEYDLKLGRATSAPPLQAWQKGVFRRDFENGIALVNPKGNGPVEVELEEDFLKLVGSQDPAVNSGQTVRRVRLEDRDGILLQRLRTKVRPLPPFSLSVE